MWRTRFVTLLLVGCLLQGVIGGDLFAATVDHAEGLSKREGTHVAEVAAEQIVLTAQDSVALYRHLDKAYLLLGRLYYPHLTIFIFLLLILLVLVFVLFLLLLRERKGRRSDERERHLYLEEMERIEGSRRALDVAATAMQQQVAQLFGEQFALLDELSTIYYETHSLKRDKEAIYKRVCDEIAHWSNQKKNARELEQIVDRYKEGVMTKLRAEMADLSELDYQILCYSYAGFSTKTISIFLGTTIGTINTRRYRLRNRIIEQNPPSKQLLLDKMGK